MPSLRLSRIPRVWEALRRKGERLCLAGVFRDLRLREDPSVGPCRTLSDVLTRNRMFRGGESGVDFGPAVIPAIAAAR